MDIIDTQHPFPFYHPSSFSYVHHFVHCLLRAIISRFNKDERSFIRELFDMFDVDRSQTITIDELPPLLSSLGLRDMPYSEIQSLFEKYDLDNSGDIDFEEFLVTAVKPSSTRR